MSNTTRFHYPTNSSLIEYLSFDRHGENLNVKFLSGETYTYHGVSSQKFAKMCRAKSVGAYYNERIKGHYTCTGPRKFMLEAQLNWMLTHSN